MRLTHRIVLATLNRHKFDEFTAILSAYPEYELLPAAPLLRNADKLKHVENHDNYLANALSKARHVNWATHYPSLADDSGLEVEALGGKPGVRSQRFAAPVEGLTQDQANTAYLLSQLKKASSRAARFVCTLAFIVEGIELHSTGILEGTLISEPRGSQGFGYDPIFVPKDSNRTLAEMTDQEKNAISHRAQALHRLVEQIKNHGIVLAKP